ncbi:MAG: hypothetical protein Q9182_006172 [Xanthomendoza sp. 2 TL-2023]
MAAVIFKRYPEPTRSLSGFRFIELPLEIRGMVYQILLTRPNVVYRYPRRTTAPASKIASCGGGVLYKAYIPDDRNKDSVNRDIDGDHHDWRLPYIPDLNLLLTNRQLLAEAAPFFYGGNKFHLMLGINPHARCKVPAWDFVDDLASISKENLRFIRSMELRLRAFDFSGDFHLHYGVHGFVLRDWNWSRCYAKSSYLDIKAGLERFADVMRGEHRLRSLNVLIDGFIMRRFDAVDRIQNALEPLASIYGIQHVSMGRVTLDFAKKMVRAMQMKSLAVEKIPEYYGMRKIRSSGGTNEEQIYNLRPYVDSRYKFCLEDKEAETNDPVAEIATTNRCLPYRLPWRVVLDYQMDSQGQARFTEAITLN